MKNKERENSNKIAFVPTQLKYVVSIERQQKIKEELYLFLLNKKEENELQLSITESNCRIIDPAEGVDQGTTRTDTMFLERQRGITIQTAVTSFQWHDCKVNIVDTPGHMDFLAEVYRSLAILDGAILVVSAKDGVQAQTRILFHALQVMKIPTVIFINKIDQVETDVSGCFLFPNQVIVG